MASERGDFRRAAVLCFAFWYLVWGNYAVAEMLARRFGFVRDLPVDLLSVAVVAGIALTLYPLARWTTGRSIAVKLAVLVPAGIAVAVAQIGVNYVNQSILGAITGLPFDQLRERYARLFMYRIYLDTAFIALLVTMLEARRSADDRVARSEAEAEAERARLAALRFQINPHFLFNAMNSISSLVVTGRAADAEEMLERLSDFLRITLTADPGQLVTLDEEMEAIQSYLAIEGVRFRTRMQTVIDCPPALANARVPGLILQPLVENAVKHGVATSSQPSTITITARAGQDQLILEVDDDGDHARADTPRAGLGVGTENVRQRLAALFGAAAGLEAGPATPRRWSSRVVLPLSFAGQGQG